MTPQLEACRWRNQRGSPLQQDTEHGAAWTNRVRSVRRTLSTCPATLCKCTRCVTRCLCDAPGLAFCAFSTFGACYALLMLRLFVASGGAFPYCTRFAWSAHEKLSRTVRRAGLMAYTLTEDKGVDLRDTGAWTLVRTTDATRQRVCISVLGVVVWVSSLASGVASSARSILLLPLHSPSHILAVLRALHVLQTS